MNYPRASRAGRVGKTGDSPKRRAFAAILLLALAPACPAAPAEFISDLRFRPGAYFQPMPFVCVPGRSGPPRVDGAPQPAEWAGARRVTRWFAAGPKPTKPPPAGELWLAYDKAGLYVAGRFAEPGLDAVNSQAAPAKRDGPVRLSTGLTVLLRAPGGARFQFTITARGQLGDRMDDDPGWNGRVRFRVRRAKDHWSLEMAIPWRSLRLPVPTRNSTIFAAFTRRAKVGGALRAFSAVTGRGSGVVCLVFGDRESFDKYVARRRAKERARVAIHMDRWEYDGSDPWAWCRARLRIAPPFRDELAKGSLVLTLDPKGAAARHVKIARIKSSALDFALDLSVLKPGQHCLQVRALDAAGRERGSAERVFRISDKTTPPALKHSVRLLLNAAPPDFRWPVTVGVPAPKGELWGESVRVTADDGKPAPAQARVVGRWSRRGSTRWLRVAFTAPPGARELRLEYGAQVRSIPPQRPIIVEETPDRILVDTGAVRFTVRRKGFRLFESVDIGPLRRKLALSGQDLFVENDSGKAFRSSLDSASRVIVEDRGPVAATIRAEGRHVARDGSFCGKYVVRINAWAGSPIVQVFHTFIVTGDSDKVRYRDIAIRPGWIGKRVLLGGEKDRAVTASNFASAYLLQYAPDRFIISASGKPLAGSRAAGWADVTGKEVGVTTAVRDFRRNFPKEFECLAGRTLVFHVWPRHGRAASPSAAGLRGDAARLAWIHQGKVLDFRYPKAYRKVVGPGDFARLQESQAMGLAKTHELYLLFHPADAPYKRIQLFGRAVRDTPTCLPDPAWLARSGAFGPAGALTPRDSGVREMLTGPLDCVLKRAEALGGWGMFSYGDGRHHFNAPDNSFALRANWCGFASPGPDWPWAAYLLTGARRYFRMAEAWSRHAMDVDVCHYVSPEWFERYGVSRARGKIVGGVCDPNAAVHWQGGASALNQPSAGFMLRAYYVSGYRRGLDCARELGQALRRIPRDRLGQARSLPAVAMLDLYRATWDNDLLERIDHVAESWLKRPRSTLDVAAMPFLARYWAWTRRKSVGDLLVRTANALVKRPWLSASAPLPCRGLTRAFLMTGESKYLRVADAALGEMNLGLYKAGGALVRGDLSAPGRPGALGQACAQAPAVLLALQRLGRPVEPAALAFTLHPWRSERAITRRGRSLLIPLYQLDALFRKPAKTAALVSTDILRRGNVRVHVQSARGASVFSKTLYMAGASQPGGLRRLAAPLPERLPAGEYRLTLTSDAPFSVLAPLSLQGVRKLVWLTPDKGYWVMSRGSRAFISAPGTPLVLEARGAPGLNTLHAFDANGRQSSFYWQGAGMKQIVLKASKGAANALWMLRRGWGTQLRIHPRVKGVALRLATTPERFFPAAKR